VTRNIKLNLSGDMSMQYKDERQTKMDQHNFRFPHRKLTVKSFIVENSMLYNGNKWIGA
jgi:hypothetical protein